MKSRMKIKQTQFERQSQQKRGSASCLTGLPVFKNIKIVLLIAVMLLLTCFTSANEATDAISKGNRLYTEGNYTSAADEYTRAIELDQYLLTAKFNKANSLYKIGELQEAIDLYKEVAARSKDANLVSSAKYNLGNCYYRLAKRDYLGDEELENAFYKVKSQVGKLKNAVDFDIDVKEKKQYKKYIDQIKNYADRVNGSFDEFDFPILDSNENVNLDSAITNCKNFVKSCRQTLNIVPDNQKAKRNIEIAKRKLKKLKEKQKQQQKQDQKQDKNKDQNQESQNPEQEKKNSQNDDNKKQDQQDKDDQQNEDQNPKDKQDQQQQQNTDEQKQQQSGKEDKKQDPLDKLAEQILKKEEKDKEKRRILMLRQIPVEKDW